MEYDALDIASEDLKTKLIPASRRLKEILKERSERQKIRKRTKKVVSGSSAGTEQESRSAADIEAERAQAEADKEADKRADELLDEGEYRAKEREELAGLVPEDVKGDLGASWTGLYELVGRCLSKKGSVGG